MKCRQTVNPKTLPLLAACLLFTAAAANAQLRIHVKPYLGAGYSRILNDYQPIFVVEDTLDQDYQTLNLQNSPRNAFRGQVRVDVLHLGPLSAGYLFWGHQVKFNDVAPNNALKTDKIYPYSVSYSLHGANLTLRLPYKGISTEHRVPFILGGAGRYYGKNKGYRYSWVDAAQTESDKQFVSQRKWEDWGYFAGIGLEVYGFAYVYAGYTALLGDDLMGSKFFDFVVGITF